MPLTGDKKRAATLKAQRIFIAKEKKQLQATLDGYLDDVKIIMEWKDGKRVVTFDMAKTTNDALELVAAAQGTTLDVILRGVISKNLLKGPSCCKSRNGRNGPLPAKSNGPSGNVTPRRTWNAGPQRSQN